jgi:hypothetical protein
VSDTLIVVSGCPYKFVIRFLLLLAALSLPTLTTTSPLPIPSLDNFVWIQSQIVSSLDEHAQEQLRTANDYGNLFGNLLVPGALHFTGSGPALVAEARALTRYLKRKHPSIAAGTIPFYVHEDEEKAVRAVLDNVDDERAWAVVVLVSAFSADATSTCHAC